MVEYHILAHAGSLPAVCFFSLDSKPSEKLIDEIAVKLRAVPMSSPNYIEFMWTQLKEWPNRDTFGRHAKT